MADERSKIEKIKGNKKGNYDDFKELEAEEEEMTASQIKIMEKIELKRNEVKPK